MFPFFGQAITVEYFRTLTENIVYLALMSKGAITVDQLWDTPISYRRIYEKIITNWYKDEIKFMQNAIKAGAIGCPLLRRK